MGDQHRLSPFGDSAHAIHFEQVVEMLRHYSSLRFRQLTIYVAVNGGLLFALFRQDVSAALFQLFAIAGLGVLAAIAFTLLEFRTHRLRDHCLELIACYERDIKTANPFADTPGRVWIFRSRLAVLLFIVGAAVLWVLLTLMMLDAHGRS